MAGRGKSVAIIFFVLIAVAIAITLGALYIQVRTDEVTAVVEQDQIVRVLVVAQEEGVPYLSVVVFFHPLTNRVAVLDIPQSVGGVISALDRVDSINVVYDPENPQPFQREIERLIGVPILNTLSFSTEQLVSFIDLLGGLELFIITDYRSVDGPAPVILPAGNVRLDGRKAVDYLRLYDENETDLERTGRRHAFVESLLQEISRNARFLLHPDVVEVRDALIDTRMDRRARDTLFRHWEEMEITQLIRRRVQGTVRTVAVEGASRRLLFPHFEGQWLKQSVGQIETTLASEVSEEAEEAVVVVEVLNGTSNSGLARRTSSLFEDFGFMVTRYGNAEGNDIEHTLVVDRRGVGAYAQQVAQVIKAQRIITEVTLNSDVDVTLILGKDFDGTIVRTNNAQ